MPYQIEIMRANRKLSCDTCEIGTTIIRWEDGRRVWSYFISDSDPLYDIQTIIGVTQEPEEGCLRVTHA